MLSIVVVVLALLIIASLSAYAGRLLFLLRRQNVRRKAAIDTRIQRICESIDVICKAMEQQQCELSEGAIRVCNLLNALPLDTQHDFAAKFPAIYELFEHVRRFAILQDRQALPKKVRQQQDRERGEIESDYETKVLNELPQIKAFCELVSSEQR